MVQQITTQSNEVQLGSIQEKTMRLFEMQYFLTRYSDKLPPLETQQINYVIKEIREDILEGKEGYSDKLTGYFNSVSYSLLREIEVTNSIDEIKSVLSNTGLEIKDKYILTLALKILNGNKPYSSNNEIVINNAVRVILKYVSINNTKVRLEDPKSEVSNPDLKILIEELNPFPDAMNWAMNHLEDLQIIYEYLSAFHRGVPASKELIRSYTKIFKKQTILQKPLDPERRTILNILTEIIKKPDSDKTKRYLRPQEKRTERQGLVFKYKQRVKEEMVKIFKNMEENQYITNFDLYADIYLDTSISLEQGIKMNKHIITRHGMTKWVEKVLEIIKGFEQ